MLFMNIFHIIAVALMVSSKWTKVFEVIIVGRLVYGFFCGMYCIHICNHIIIYYILYSL